MKLQFIVLSLLVGSLAQAQDLVIKKMVCENGHKKAVVKVHQSSEGSLGTVEWHVQDKTTGKTSSFSGYLYAEDGLNSFNSLDVFDGLDVHGHALTLTDLSSDGEGEVLVCRW